MANRIATVFGAYGHTGRFIVAELRRRGWSVTLAGRNLEKLAALAATHPGIAVRYASIDDPASLDRALDGSDVVINSAGPFAFTAGPVIESAMRVRIPYLDVAAEIEANLDTFEAYGERARAAGIVVVPAVAFFGGLGDLLASAALGKLTRADEISIAYGLDSWKPTPGTKAAGSVSQTRRNGRRFVFADGALEYRTDAAPRTTWTFPAPLGEQPVVGEFTMADTVTIARHIDVAEIRSYMTVAAVEDLGDERSGPPHAVDAGGRSAQRFTVDVVVRCGQLERRATASGRDIYAVSAPLIVGAAERVLLDPIAPGVYSAGELFDARSFLLSLGPGNIAVSFSADVP